MTRDGASGIAVLAACQNGPSGGMQHPMRHTDRRRAELCKVLHIEMRARLLWNCMCLNIKFLFFAFRAMIGPWRAVTATKLVARRCVSEDMSVCIRSSRHRVAGVWRNDSTSYIPCRGRNHRTWRPLVKHIRSHGQRNWCDCVWHRRQRVQRRLQHNFD